MFGKRIGIKAKILIVMLLLTVITFGLAAILTLSNIKNVGSFTLKSCSDLGEETLQDSRVALLEHSREELLSLVVGQAKIANVQLDHIENKLAMLANLSGRYLLGEISSLTKSNEQRFLSFKKPDLAFSKSRIIIYSKDNEEKRNGYLSRLGRFHPLLRFIYGDQHNLDMVYLYSTAGYYVSYPWTKPADGFLPFKRQWYHEAVKASGKVVWIGPYISANSNKIIMTCARAIKNFQNKIIAVCGLDITVKEITQSFISMKLVHEGQAFLLDKAGNILARREMKNVDMHWHENFKKENMLKSKNASLREVAAKMVAGGEGVTVVKVPGTPELHLAYAPVSTTEWSIGVLVKSAVLTASVRKVEELTKQNIQKHRARIKSYFKKNLKIYLATGMIVLFLVMIWGILFSHKITAPILLLKKKALKIATGNFKSNIHLHTGDELEDLDRNFDQMTKEITHYMHYVRDTVREREKIEQEFAVAGNIQSYMLPSKFKKVSELAIEAYLKPAHAVSGDFYNYFMLDEKHLFFCIGKVAGTGVPAAMLMAQVMTLLSHLGSMKIEPEKLLLIVNNTLVINNKTDMSVSAFCGFLDVESGKLVFSNAEHVPSVYIHNTAVSAPLLGESPALGIDPVEEGVFIQNCLQLSRGDILFFTTNGIDMTENERGEVFGEKKLLNYFSKVKDSKTSVIKFALAVLKKFYGSQISKRDIALLTIEYKGGGK